MQRSPEDADAPPEPAQTGKTSGRRSLALSLADQLTSSVGNFALLFLLARSSSIADFGFLAITIAVLTLGLALARGGLGGLAALDLPRATGEEARLLVGRLTGGAWIVGGCTTAALLLLSLFSTSSDTALATALIGIAAPMVMIQDLGRYVAVARGQAATALASDLLWTAVPGTALVLGVVGKFELSASLAALAWVGGLAGGLTLMMIAGTPLRPRWEGFVGWVRAEPRLRHLSSDGFLSAGAPLALALLVSALAGLDANGALRGASTIFGPINVLIAATTLGALPEARRLGERAGTRLLTMVTAALTLGTAAWGISVIVSPDAWWAALLGDTWDTAKPLLPWFTVEYVAIAIWAGASAVLRMRDRTRSVLIVRLFYSAATLVAGGLVAGLTHDALGVAVSRAAAAVLVAGSGVLAVGLPQARPQAD